MTLKGVIAVILRYFTEFGNLEATHVNRVKVKLILGKESSFRQYIHSFIHSFIHILFKYIDTVGSTN